MDTLTKLGWCAAHLWRENGARRKISGCAAQIGAIGCAAQDRRNEGAPILRGAPAEHSQRTFTADLQTGAMYAAARCSPI